MNKKNLKRSLALGALMAFVITGNAFAAALENNATTAHSIAVGENAVSTGICSVSIGLNASSDIGSTAIGEDTRATGGNATAYGKNAQATGASSVAVGVSANASGNNGVAIGNGADAVSGVAIGAGSDANNSNTVAIGNNAKAGKDGDTSANAAIAIGDRAVSAQAGDIAIGMYAQADSTANGYSATAVGREAVASGKCAVAYGKSAQALNNRATAIGHNAVANGIGDLALGAESATSQVASVNGITVGGVNYSFAGGDANTNNAIVAASIGGQTTSSAFGASSSEPKNVYRQLQNVAAGQVNANSTDAVNGSQLYAAYQAIDANAALETLRHTTVINELTGHDERIAANATAIEVNAALETLRHTTVINELTGHDERIAANATAIKVNEELETLRHETVINELTDHDERIIANATAISENRNVVAGLDQRLGKLNGKVNKVGAGAAALAALHPLEYDPEDKLTFSAGMGNYAGENAAALGAFYRPNEKFMVSLGGTMGNGENMVNLGISVGLDKPNGFAKMSKRELIQKVNSMEAEMAELRALVIKLAAEKK